MENKAIEKLLFTIKDKYESEKDRLNLTESDYSSFKNELKFMIRSESLMKDILYYIREKKFGGTKNLYNSMVFYVLGITNKKPDTSKEFNFEYELDRKNTRLSPPDIDVDFEYKEDIIKYLEGKYGKDHVSLIGTSGTYGPKAAVQFCAKALNIAGTKYEENSRRFSSENDQEAKRLSKIMPNMPAYSLEQWLGEKEIEEFKNQRVCSAIQCLQEEKKKYPKVFEMAKRLCGLNKNYGTHAAGIVISDRPVFMDIPLFVAKQVDSNEMSKFGLEEDDISFVGGMSTQYDWKECEEIGLLKFDILHINTLRQMTLVENMVRERYGKKIDIENLVPNDPNVFKTINDLKLEGVFQLCGGAYSSLYVKKDKETWKPVRDPKTKKIKLGKKAGLMEIIGCRDFNDIIAANALGRPGALAFKLHEKYRKSKDDPGSIKYSHPDLEPILKKTYGQLCFQEDLIKMAIKLAGFSFFEADGLRKACAKKEKILLDPIKPKFIEGCLKNKISQNVIDEMWEVAVAFGHYAFNLAHSAAYAFIAYQTAWLKTYYPMEFISTILTDKSKKDEETLEISIEKFLTEYKKLKILPVDVNFSKKTYYPEGDNSIRSPLDSIKGVGPKSSEEIVKNQPYVSVCDFMSRVGSIFLNSREIEVLKQNNAFASFGTNEQVANEILSYQKMFDMTVRNKKTNTIIKTLF